ncbi:MAG: Oxidoreductase, short-chain dehydrogenase/reductase family, partial [uncultured Thermomicrobiales bacterium]
DGSFRERGANPKAGAIPREVRPVGGRHRGLRRHRPRDGASTCGGGAQPRSGRASPPRAGRDGGRAEDTAQDRDPRPRRRLGERGRDGGDRGWYARSRRRVADRRRRIRLVGSIARRASRPRAGNAPGQLRGRAGIDLAVRTALRGTWSRGGRAHELPGSVPGGPALRELRGDQGVRPVARGGAARGVRAAGRRRARLGPRSGPQRLRVACRNADGCGARAGDRRPGNARCPRPEDDRGARIAIKGAHLLARPLAALGTRSGDGSRDAGDDEARPWHTPRHGPEACV